GPRAADAEQARALSIDRRRVSSAKVGRTVDFVSNAEVERQAWLHLPIIFEERRPLIFNLLANSFLVCRVVFPHTFFRVVLPAAPTERACGIHPDPQQVQPVRRIRPCVCQLVRQPDDGVAQSGWVSARSSRGSGNDSSAVSGRAGESEVDAHTEAML